MIDEATNAGDDTATIIVYGRAGSEVARGYGMPAGVLFKWLRSEGRDVQFHRGR
jgi:hypothetical protein